MPSVLSPSLRLSSTPHDIIFFIVGLGHKKALSDCDHHSASFVRLDAFPPKLLQEEEKKKGHGEVVEILTVV